MLGHFRLSTHRWLARVLIVGAAATVFLPPIDLATTAPAYADACGPTSKAALPDEPWPMRRLRPERVWPISRGNGVTVAVIDSGVSDLNPVLTGKLVQGIDLVEQGGNGTCDLAGHGTMIAGIIVGARPASSGFYGVAPGAKIMPIRVLADTQRSFDEEAPVRIARAIRMATDAGVKVINLSLTTENVPELKEAVRYAVSKDVVLVAASGNEGGAKDNPEAYPAAYPDVIAVAGVDEFGNHVATSSAGAYVDVAAPGLRIEGPAPQGGGFVVREEGGTSFAAAYVSGVAALVRSYQPELKAPQVIQRILRSADHPPNGWDRVVGYGVVNPYWAVVSVPAAEDDEPSPPEPIALSPPQPDPLGGVKTAAIWTAVLAIVLSGLVIASVSVLHNGRLRRWRPGRPGRET